ncbi:hypothetical protein FOZ61_001686 [Perkinsus olseni]|uniref:Uncharacterized protein n=1 Tax=Perkinsus olseni TaxID=32597 RepID=A0A7J6LVU1_PEROL|nr:hypothetical protein FOZ61_001686 [Perkinsus olseni]
MDGPVANPMQDPDLRSLRLPVEKSYCGYVLKGPSQVNGGVLMASNNSGYTGFATLEMAVILAPNSSPVDVGVWADGRTLWLFDLAYGISVGVDLSIPTSSKTGGYDYFRGFVPVATSPANPFPFV